MPNVVFTGKGYRRSGEHYTRPQWGILAAQFNYTEQDHVTPSTDYLVMADPNSTSVKARTARGWGVNCISYADFEAMVLAGQSPRGFPDAGLGTNEPTTSTVILIRYVPREMTRGAYYDVTHDRSHVHRDSQANHAHGAAIRYQREQNARTGILHTIEADAITVAEAAQEGVILPGDRDVLAVQRAAQAIARAGASAEGAADAMQRMGAAISDIIGEDGDFPEEQDPVIPARTKRALNL